MEIMTPEKTAYFDWLYDKAFGNNYHFRELAMYLFQTPFMYVLERDENRAINGVGLRYQFGVDLGDEPCSMLEMMVRLAMDIEDILDNNEDDRTHEWVGLMLDNAGFGRFDDNYIIYYDDYSIDELHRLIDKVMYREYPRDGRGSFFPTHRDVDMRRVELWYQAMWYLVDNNIA